MSHKIAAQPLYGVTIVDALFCGGAGIFIFFATLGHFFNAGLGFGMGGEHLGDIRAFLAAFHCKEFFKSHYHAPGILAL